MLAPKSNVVEVADPVALRGRQKPRMRERQVSRDASRVCTAGVQSKGFMGTREIRQAQNVLVGSDKRDARGRSDGQAEVRLTDSTQRPGEPVRPEYSCKPWKIIMMESLNDWEFGNLAQFG